MSLIEISGTSAAIKPVVEFYDTFTTLDVVKRNWALDQISNCEKLDKDLIWLRTNAEKFISSKLYRTLRKRRAEAIRARLTLLLYNLDYLKIFYDAFILNSTFIKNGKKLKINNKKELDNYLKLCQEFTVTLLGLTLKLDIAETIEDLKAETDVVDAIVPNIEAGYFKHIPHYVLEFSFK